MAGSGGKWREVAGSDGKWREVAGSGGKWREVAGSGGKWREMQKDRRSMEISASLFSTFLPTCLFFNVFNFNI